MTHRKLRKPIIYNGIKSPSLGKSNYINQLKLVIFYSFPLFFVYQRVASFDARNPSSSAPTNCAAWSMRAHPSHRAWSETLWAADRGDHGTYILAQKEWISLIDLIATAISRMLLCYIFRRLLNRRHLFLWTEQCAIIELIGSSSWPDASKNLRQAVLRIGTSWPVTVAVFLHYHWV